MSPKYFHIARSILSEYAYSQRARNMDNTSFVHNSKNEIISPFFIAFYHVTYDVVFSNE